jgi:hypothetical protein
MRQPGIRWDVEMKYKFKFYPSTWNCYLHDEHKDDQKTQYHQNTNHENEKNLHFLHKDKSNIFPITAHHYFDTLEICYGSAHSRPLTEMNIGKSATQPSAGTVWITMSRVLR